MYHLGIDLGTTFTAAAVSRAGAAPEMVGLGDRSMVVPSVLYIGEDGNILVGVPAERRGLTDPERIAREFKRRIGDSTPILLAGSPWSPQALSAEMLRWVMNLVTERQGGPPGRVAVSHPANWGPFKIDLLEQAIEMAGIESATLVSEPEAAAVHWASQERVAPGTKVIVYDLGGGTFDIAILEKTDTGFRFLGEPSGIEHLGGLDLDAAVFDHVRRQREGEFAELDPDDAAVRQSGVRLRADCIAAKEALSSDTHAIIPLLLPNVTGEVRLTRVEFEEAIRPALGQTIDALRRALSRAGLAPEDLDTTLLVGGSSRVPLVAQIVSAELGRPVAVDTHPKHAVALGAVRVLDAVPTEVDAAGTPEQILEHAGIEPAGTIVEEPRLTVSEAASITLTGQVDIAAPPPSSGPAEAARPAEPASAALPPTSPPPRPEADPPLVGTPTSAREKGGRRRLPLVIGAVVAVAAIAGAALVLLSGGGDSDPELLWQFETNSALASKPAVADDTLVIGATVTGAVHAVDTETGEERWTTVTGAGVSADPAIDDGTTYIGSQDGFVYALDLQTGEEIWRSDRGIPVDGGTFVLDGIVYVGDDNGVVAALDQSTGEEIWEFATGGRINNTPALAQRLGNDVLVVGSTDGGLYLLDPLTGEQQERVALEGGVWFSTPLVLDRLDGEGQEVWIGTSTQDGGLLNLVVLDTLEVMTFLSDGGVGTDPALTDNGLVVVGNDDGVLFAVSRSSLGEVWREGYADNTQIKGSPAVDGDRVFIGTHDSELIAVDAETGEEEWTFTGEQVFGLSAPTVDGTRLYVGDDSGAVYSFDIER